MIKLHIGCGIKYKKGYVNIDAYDGIVADVIMDAIDLKYNDESIDLIESFQLIEHFGLINSILALGEWFRVLKTNSSVVVETPDFDKALDIFTKSNDHEQKAIMLNWIYGLPNKGYDHKFCFPAGLLRKLLIETGFVDIMENHHEKTFGIPTYTFIAKKPLDVNPNNLLIHQLRKQSFSTLEIFNSDLAENYKMDFEKSVLGYTTNYIPRDFSIVTFNELFTNSVTYSPKTGMILLEESEKLGIIPNQAAENLLEKLNLLEEYSYTKYIYHIWQETLLKNKSPEEASLISIETAKNIAKQALFDVTIEDFKSNIEQLITQKDLYPIIDESIFSLYLIESKVSRFLAKYIKGTANDEEIRICQSLATNT
ncbi:MAG: methyltransferase domain-containing protein [Cyanobacteriota bacterium]